MGAAGEIWTWLAGVTGLAMIVASWRYGFGPDAVLIGGCILCDAVIVCQAIREAVLLRGVHNKAAKIGNCHTFSTHERN